jgi:hypothetical protein
MKHETLTSGFWLLALVACGSGCVSASPKAPSGEKFSFFVTSYAALQRLSGSQDGFGGDLRFGETGPGAGLRGADRICAAIAETSMPGAGTKPWRAFLSASDDGAGHPVNAIDRIGQGPWYDRLGRLFGNTVAEIQAARPAAADSAIQNDFPNEEGTPNHQPDPTQGAVDNHDMLTGSDESGHFYAADATCLDWTGGAGDVASEGRPRVGHSWPRGLGDFGAGGGFGAPGGDAGVPGRGRGGRPPGGLDGGVPPFGGGFAGGGMFPDGIPPLDGGVAPGFPGLDGGVFAPGDIGNADNWMSALTESGCKAGANLIEMGPPNTASITVGSGGGYGGFYCFSMTP